MVSEADGNRDVIHSGENGYVCRTKEEYIKALEELLSNRELAVTMGKKAHGDIMAKYNVTAMETAYRALFCSMEFDLSNCCEGGVIYQRSSVIYCNTGKLKIIWYICKDQYEGVGYDLPREAAA